MSIPLDLTKTPPTLTGPGGAAWRFEPEWMKDAPAALSTWLVHCPRAHPLWQWWMVSVVHLREQEGQPPAQKSYPEAEYEFMVLAISPESGNPPSPPYTFLQPVDVSVHFHGLKDDQVGLLTEHAAKLITSGWISPDQDFRSAWSTLLPNVAANIAKGQPPPEPKDMPAVIRPAFEVGWAPGGPPTVKKERGDA